MSVAAESNAAVPDLLEAQEVRNSQDQMLIQQLAETIRAIGDKLDQNQGFNDMIDGLVKVADRSSFGKLVDKVFTDDQINWGRIIVLFYSIGRLSAKIHCIPALVCSPFDQFSSASLRNYLPYVGIGFAFTSGLLCMTNYLQKAGMRASLPAEEPMSEEQEQVLNKAAGYIRDIGDALDKEAKFNDMVDGFARLANMQSFQCLGDKVFHDGISWGKIVIFICVVGKSFAKILADYIQGVVSWTLDYLRNNLLNWISNSGGWISSLPSLTGFSFERDFGGSTALLLSTPVLAFFGGVLLGSFIVWGLNRRS
ncbi:hypothetical protein DNTS_001236 [Danionella cerebrum]|nr:hypothetical protein DNTS_001236 [Danionella translucida]